MDFLFKVLTRTLFELSFFLSPSGLTHPHPLAEYSQRWGTQSMLQSVVMLEVNQVIAVFSSSFNVAFGSGNAQLVCERE